MTDSGGALVGIVMGSDSDWPTMRAAAEALDEFDVAWEARVLSAHRTPRTMLDWAEAAADRHRRHRDARGHLDDREQGVHPVQVA